MDAKNQTRSISTEFMNDLISGVLAPLTEKVKNKEYELILCLRKDYVNVYYKCGSLYKIEEQNDCYKISFDFGYASKTKNKDELLSKLEKFGFDKNKIKSGSPTTIIKISKDEKKVTVKEFFEIATAILIKFMSDKKENKIGEKMRQQEIFLANNNPNSDFFIYDCEFKQPRNNENEQNTGRFDLLALKKVGKVHRLVFCELKTTKAACKGGSSVLKHSADFYNYTDCSNGKDYIQARKNEALSTYEFYCKLNGLQKKILDINVDSVDVLFIYTDEAIAYLDEFAIKLAKPFKINFEKK